MKRDKEDDTTRTTRRYFTDKPINYYPRLNDAFDGWAADCGWDSQSLRNASERAICFRHHEAIIAHEFHKARGNQPDICTLSLGSVDVIYTVEPLEVVIRGYGWEIDREPLDHGDGGGFYAEVSWEPST